MTSGYIYNIHCNKTNKNYIGSTFLTLQQRLSQHKSGYKRYTNNKSTLYCSSYEILENNDYCINILEEIEDMNDIINLRNKEAQYIKSMDCVNKNIPSRTLKQYYIDNKESYKEYYKQNRDKIIKYNKQQYKNKYDYYTEKAKEYRQNNKDKFKQYYENNKEKLKQYGRDNYNKKKEYYLEKNKNWANENKDKVKELTQKNTNKYKSIIYKCPCNEKEYNKLSLYHHLKSKKHNDYCNSNDNDIIIKCLIEGGKDIIIPCKTTIEEFNNIL